MYQEIEKFERSLHTGNYKLTSQREAIFELLENTKGHLTAEEIHGLLKDKNPDIGLSTVYRTLRLLTDIGLVRRLNLDDRPVYYELNRSPHNHLICLSCGRIIDIDNKVLEGLDEKIKKYKFKSQRVIIFGECQECSRKSRD